MSLEITDREEFKDKFAALMAANVSLITSGIEPSRDLSSQMIDEFLNQFTMTTPAPAVPKSAGFVIINAHTGDIPADFKGRISETVVEAQLAVTRFLAERLYIKTHDYRIVEATYFG